MFSVLFARRQPDGEIEAEKERSYGRPRDKKGTRLAKISAQGQLVDGLSVKEAGAAECYCLYTRKQKRGVRVAGSLNPFIKESIPFEVQHPRTWIRLSFVSFLRPPYLTLATRGLSESLLRRLEHPLTPFPSSAPTQPVRSVPYRLSDRKNS